MAHWKGGLNPVADPVDEPVAPIHSAPTGSAVLAAPVIRPELDE